MVEYLARNGKSVKAISIDGNLFFGSIPTVEKEFFDVFGNQKANDVVVIKTDHLSYIDIPAARLMIKAVLDSSNEAYIYVSRNFVLDGLKKAGLKAEEIDEFVIFKDKDHLMKSVLYPYQSNRQATIPKLIDTKSLTKRIKKTALLNSFSEKLLSSLLIDNPQRFAESGEIIVRQDEVMNDHFILIDGEIEVQRIWSIPQANDKSHTWTLAPINKNPAVLPAASNHIRVRAISDVQYILLSGDTVDNLLGWVYKQESGHHKNSATEKLMRMVAASHHLPKEIIDKILQELTPRDVEAGEVIIRETEKGDNFYLIESGEAEVVRTDPFTERSTVINQIGKGDSFGEEALIQGGLRNATIRMLTPGRLQVLGRDAFEKFVQAELVKEISAEEAFEELKKENVRLIDCRYDMEYRDSHIDGAKLLPLHELRERVSELDSSLKYLVYCRSGKRSKAAAYLLRERNIEAISIKGGIKNWPYETVYQVN